MDIDDIRIEPALLDDIIPSEVFYDWYNPKQVIRIDQKLQDQIALEDFNQLIENVQHFLEANRDWGYTFDLLIVGMELEIPENQRLTHIEILRKMVLLRKINGNQIKGKFYHCYRNNDT